MDMEVENFIWNVRSLLNNSNLILNSSFQKTLETFFADIKKIIPQNGNEFVTCPMDPHHFDFRRSVYCRRCKISFRATWHDYMIHTSSHEHYAELVSSAIHHNKQEKEDEVTEAVNDLVETSSSNDLNQSSDQNNNLVENQTHENVVHNESIHIPKPIPFKEDILTSFIKDNLLLAMDAVAVGNELFVKHFRETFNLMRCIYDSYVIYGSWNCGLATIDSDVNVLMIFKDQYGSITQDGENLLNCIKSVMQHSDNWTNVCVKMSSKTFKTDTLMAKNRNSDQWFEFSLYNDENMLRCLNSGAINCLLNIQPKCRKVIICIRILMKIVESYNNISLDGFTGYIISLLTIFFFRTKDYLPPLSSVQTETPFSRDFRKLFDFVGDCLKWNRHYEANVCEESMRDILIQFFEFYLNFEFDMKVIDLDFGRPIDKSSIDPNEKIYNKFLQKRQSMSSNWLRRDLCIRDMYNWSENAGYSINEDEMGDFKCFCATALRALKAVENDF